MKTEIVKNGGNHQHQTVNPVQQTTMTGQDSAEVLDAQITLDRGQREVSHLPQGAHHETENEQQKRAESFIVGDHAQIAQGIAEHEETHQAESHPLNVALGFVARNGHNRQRSQCQRCGRQVPAIERLMPIVALARDNFSRARA